MKKHTEKRPIDDLFARKLGNMSMPPSADGFERLQARMGQRQPEARIIFWRNPIMQPYMAVAACLLLVCLFGWLYWPSGGIIGHMSEPVATNQPLILPSRKSVQPQNKATPDAGMPIKSVQEANSQQVAMLTKSARENKRNNGLGHQSTKANKSVETKPALVYDPILAQTKPTESKPKTDVSMLNSIAPTNQAITEQLADNKIATKPGPVIERVLVVTLEEPQALVAARQVEKPSIEEPVVATITNDKPEKEVKGGSLWQQVKRIKQGDVFARQDTNSNDDRGLLSRAYSGIKHSFEKDKSAKQ